MIRKLTLKKEREHETNEASIAGNVMRDLIAHVTNDNLIGRKIKSGELRKKRTGFVRIEIEDQGIGIPQSEYHKIFQRFYRGTAPEVREKSGTGIGLYLSRQIIEQHGGTITVASGKVRKGSTFLIQLPENGLS